MSPKYSLDKRIGWYEIMPASAAASQPDYMLSAPNVVHTVIGDIVVGSKDYQVAQALGLLTSGSGGILSPDGSSATISGTGADSNNGVGISSAGEGVFDLTNLVNVINTLQSNATSGNVDAAKNTQVGDAQTGAATVVANLINLLASAWSWSNGNLNFFMQTLLAPHDGDISLNPTESTAGGGGSAGGVGINDPSSLKVNAQNTGNITNNVNVNAQSGDATATKNTTAGNIASGSALAQVNIINLINSFITSGSSFFGILNIIGNLNGDILFPTGFLNGLVPTGSTNANVSGTGANSTNQVGVDNSVAATINNADTKTVNNNIQTSAATGTATADANTTAGNVGSGSASTTQSVFNLANSSIFGDNAVLVMVNVMGHWLGKLMSLPGTGASQSALLTGNATVSNTGADSTNQANIDNATTADVNTKSVGTITNNVNVNAQSGDATATKNTKVGDVTTGDAKAETSVANLFNAVLDVKHWFGVLIINVFGDWVGDVNHDSEAGGYSTMAADGTIQGTAVTKVAQPSALPAVGLLALVSPMSTTVSGGGYSAGTPSQTAQVSPKVLTAAVHFAPTNTAAAAKAKNMSVMFIASAAIMMVAGALITIDKKLNNR